MALGFASTSHSQVAVTNILSNSRDADILAKVFVAGGPSGVSECFVISPLNSFRTGFIHFRLTKVQQKGNFGTLGRCLECLEQLEMCKYRTDSIFWNMPIKDNF